MSKTMKSKGGKIPKLTEEEYAKYISSLREDEELLNPPDSVEEKPSHDAEKEKE